MPAPRVELMPSGVIDFSNWNTLPWWRINGYASEDEAWNDFARTQRRDYPDAMQVYPDKFKPSKNR